MTIFLQWTLPDAPQSPDGQQLLSCMTTWRLPGPIRKPRMLNERIGLFSPIDTRVRDRPPRTGKIVSKGVTVGDPQAADNRLYKLMSAAIPEGVGSGCSAGAGVH
jgi:hypothetical protein